MIEKRDWSGLGIDFSAFDPITVPVPEPEPETLKLSEATDVSFSEDELSPLHTINKNKVEEGQALIQFDSMEQEQLRGRCGNSGETSLNPGPIVRSLMPDQQRRPQNCCPSSGISYGLILKWLLTGRS